VEVHGIRGQDVREALERARAQLGNGAVVVSKARNATGVTLAVAPSVPRSARDLEQLRRRAESLLEAETRGGRARPGTADVRRAMRRVGASKSLVEHVAEHVGQRLAEGRHPLDLAAEEIGRLFRVARGGARGSLRTFAFVGPAGVGKTTSIVKLALRLVRAGRRTALATLDGGRVGAVEQLHAYAKLLDVPLFVLGAASELPDRRAALDAAEVLLLDTTGEVDADAREIATLRAALASARPEQALDAYLVLAAGASRAALAETQRAASGARPDAALLTKIDETRIVAPALEHVLAQRLPVAFLSDGPDIASRFHRPSGELFADLLLRGRLR